MQGFDLIKEVKETLKLACPSTVSCADIITLATRDVVALAGGPKYEGIKNRDMVSLIGGHTVGKAFGTFLDAKTPFVVDNQYYYLQS
ncbi:hypothetical protein K1719_027053 [Acacia pycnantha]|nr:hypothetical protein K1719_027053 [Acacia pycnantha]